jgi:hypothetical protein
MLLDDLLLFRVFCWPLPRTTILTDDLVLWTNPKRNLDTIEIWNTNCGTPETLNEARFVEV